MSCLLTGANRCIEADDVNGNFREAHVFEETQSMLPFTRFFARAYRCTVADRIGLKRISSDGAEDAQCLLPFSALFTRADGCIEATYVREYVRHKHRNEQDQRVLPLPGLTCTELVAIFALPMKSKVLLYKLCDDYHD